MKTGTVHLEALSLQRGIRAQLHVQFHLNSNLTGRVLVNLSARYAPDTWTPAEKRSRDAQLELTLGGVPLVPAP